MRVSPWATLSKIKNSFPVRTRWSRDYSCREGRLVDTFQDESIDCLKYFLMLKREGVWDV